VGTAGGVVVARGLAKLYGDFRAVDGIDLTIQSHECFGFLGPNGAGKTTTMRMMSCLSHRDSGDLQVLGMDPDHHGRQLKARLGVVAQEMNLDLELTVRENLKVYARYFDIGKAQAQSRADELLDFVQLTERADDRVEHLSGGMKRRLQIARALVNAPELVLLDEPTTGLDPQARHLVWERLRALRDQGTTIVITTHYMDEAAQLCDRLVVMDHGKIAHAGTPAELIRDVVGAEVLELRVESGRSDELVAYLGDQSRGHQRAGDFLLLFSDDGEALHHAALESGVPSELNAIRRGSLEDVFLALTGRSLRDDS
jgi:lipooligosaccharide transport system ATP-binding protein